ncbi:MAG: glycosyltransferase family 2 protein [Acidobacteria bacterium]|nr:glycosyltransferase family 2 protein [Acidobacteriota bacterium]
MDAGPARVAIVIPALNEEDAISLVLSRLPYAADIVTVVDAGSIDRTVDLARAAGARVLIEPRRGYGRACRAGIAANPEADVIAFIDADLSEDPSELPRLVDPLARNKADCVLTRRYGPGRPWHARLGTALCVALINAGWRTRFRDLGPLRAIRRDALERLEMRDETWGWTIEMQVKVVEAGLRWLEIPVECRPRIGRSKISGTLSGTVRAGTRMLATIASLWWTRARRARG